MTAPPLAHHPLFTSMFRRVTPETWSQLTALTGFLLTFLVFLGAVLRAWRLQKIAADKLSQLPFASEHPAPETTRHE